MIKYLELNEANLLITATLIIKPEAEPSAMSTLLYLSSSAKIYFSSFLGRTVYMKAAGLGHIESLDLLLSLCEYPDIDAVDIEGRNILYYCLHDTSRHQHCFR